MDYLPTPIETDEVVLPSALLELSERLAEHVHDCWAQARLAQGWSHGPVRDDAQKKHPCLVPYSDLSEEEKHLDRVTAQGTLKAILKLGFEIQSPLN